MIEFIELIIDTINSHKLLNEHVWILFVLLLTYLKDAQESLQRYINVVKLLAVKKSFWYYFNNFQGVEQAFYHFSFTPAGYLMEYVAAFNFYLFRLRILQHFSRFVQ